MKKTPKTTRKVSSGLSRSRRPKQGLSKQITFWVNEEEKARIEAAAKARGVSMSRFVMEESLKKAQKVLTEAKKAKIAQSASSNRKRRKTS